MIVLDIDSVTDCIPEYMNFCVEIAEPSKGSNNKPWVAPDLKALLSLQEREGGAEQRAEGGEIHHQEVQSQFQEEAGAEPLPTYVGTMAPVRSSNWSHIRPEINF